MRKSLVRFSLAAASLLVVLGQASAQGSVSFWYNHQGDASGNQPPVINVNQGDNVVLSVYDLTSGVGALAGINVMFGFSTTTTGGADPSQANRSDAGSHLLDFNSWTWAQSDLNSGQLFAGYGGGGGVANGTSRPWGYFVSTGNLSGTFAGTGDGTNFHIGDISLHVNAAPGSNLPINIWSVNGTDNFASAVLNGNGAEFFPGQPYTGTIHVNAVPEPATLAALGLGAIALIRRRRRS